MLFEELPPEVREHFRRQQEQERERVEMFGAVRPPIAIEHKGQKVVAVGSRLFINPNWKTFHDFLVSYLCELLTRQWYDAECVKPPGEQHPLVRWYHHMRDLRRKQPHAAQGDVVRITATGPAMAFLALAYDLYTLEHHELLQERLINRIKNKNQFQGARYEAYVAAAFVRAGFRLKLEDETDATSTHCEFEASHIATGATYSVEAKSRHRPGFLGHPGAPQDTSAIEADISRLLAAALRKTARFPRIVFIDVNVPPQTCPIFEAEWVNKVCSQLEHLEKSGVSTQAFVFFTNHPYHYVGDDAPEPGKTEIFTGFNIPGFRSGDKLDLERDHPAINALHASVVKHTRVPHELLS